MPLLFLCYAGAMADPVYRKIARWALNQLLWDTAGTSRAGFWRGFGRHGNSYSLWLEQPYRHGWTGSSTILPRLPES